MLQSGVYVDDVEPEDAADLAKELQGDVLKKLSHNKVRKAFVFDFLSALAGRHLKGATKIDGRCLLQRSTKRRLIY